MTKSELEKIIREANYAYWNNNNPVISDTEYDRYVELLKQIDPDNELLFHIGGTKGKYRHKPPMLSLAKAYSIDAVIKWADGVARSKNEMFAIQPKYDGLAGKIENGRLSTRGDGTLGEDITSHARLIGIEHVVDDNIRRYTFDKYINLVEVRTRNQIYGELLIRHKDFVEYFESGKILRADGNKYSNPRNAVAGIFNQKDIDILPDGIITFVPYSVQSILVTYDRLPKVIESMIQETKQFYGLKYPLDGVVIKLYDEAYSEQLGHTAHHPKGAIAYKFTNASSVGYVRDVVWQSGKEVLTPVLTLQEPVWINGSNVTRATCHNYKFFKEMNFKVGQGVHIEKAGDIIPKIIGVASDSDGEYLKSPTSCPVCGSPVEEVGVELVCSNVDCIGKIVPRMVYAAKMLHIDGFGPATIELIVSRLKVKYLYQLLEFNYCYDIGHFPGFTDYSADILYRQLNTAVGNITEAELLASLCIPGIGLELSMKLLIDHTFKEWFIDWALPRTEAAKLIGPTRANILWEFYDEHKSLFELSYKYFKPLPVIMSNASADKICFTGKFPISRDACKKLVESKNMLFTDSMTSDVTCLVVADPSSTSSKTKYAHAHKIRILSYKEFLDRYDAKQ